MSTDLTKIFSHLTHFMYNRILVLFTLLACKQLVVLYEIYNPLNILKQL